MTKDDDKADEVSTGLDFVGDAFDLAGAALPFVGPVVKTLAHVEKRRRAKRLNILFLVAMDSTDKFQPSDPEVVKAVHNFAENDEDVLAVVRRALEADEEGKVWLYGAMLRAFALKDVSDATERLRMLRFAEMVVGHDLELFLQVAAKGLRQGKSLEGGRPAALGNTNPVVMALNQTGLTFAHKKAQVAGELEMVPTPNTGMWRLFAIAEVALAMRDRLLPVVGRQRA